MDSGLGGEAGDEAAQAAGEAEGGEVGQEGCSAAGPPLQLHACAEGEDQLGQGHGWGEQEVTFCPDDDAGYLQTSATPPPQSSPRPGTDPPLHRG